MRNLTFVLSLISGLSFFSQPAFGAIFSVHEDGNLDGINGVLVRNGDIASATADASGVLVEEETIFGNLSNGEPQNRDIDALALLPDGRYVFSIAETQSASVGGVDFTDGDLVAYDPSDGSAEMFLSAATLGSDGFPLDVDAVHVRDNGNVLLSISVPGLIDGMAVKDGDIYEYDPTTEIGSIFLHEEDMFGDPEVDISGISVVGGKVLLTTREDATFFDGHEASTYEISQYDRATETASLYLSFEDRMDTATKGLDAVAFVPECDDGIDNDGDGLFDAVEDPGCAGMASVDQEAEFTEIPACGLGFELAFLLLPLMGLRKRSV